MNIKAPIVVLAALSLTTGIALASNKTQQASAVISQKRALNRIMQGNSWSFYKHRIGCSGMWLGANGQVQIQGNSQYLLSPRSDTTLVPAWQERGFAYAYSLPFINIAIGYDAGPVGLVSVMNYNQIPYKRGDTISYGEDKLSLAEAYVTYKINPSWFVKAGKYNGTLGIYNPAEVVFNDADMIRAQSYTGVEAGFVAHHFFGTASAQTGIGDGGASENVAIPTFAIFNAGYKAQMGPGILLLDLGYQSKYAELVSPFNHQFYQKVVTPKLLNKVSVWSMQAGYSTAQLRVGLGALSIRDLVNNGQASNPWAYNLRADYKLSHSTSVGAFFDYANDDNDALVDKLDPFRYTFGLNMGYRLSRYASFDAFLQYSTPLPAAILAKANTSLLLSTTFNL